MSASVSPAVQTSATATTAVQLTVQIGSLLQVQVADSNNIASPAASTSAPMQLTMGVHTLRGAFQPAIFRIKDSAGINHFDVTIPFDTTVNFEILRSKLQITQSNGEPLTASVGVQHSSTASGAPPVLQFQITGSNP